MPALRVVSSRCKASGVSMAPGSEPRPPALLTAMARAAPCTPAIGAWINGNSVCSSSVRVVMRGLSVRRALVTSAPA
ncbi:hypothetical protein FQZ97_1016650 [compost metagenome]